MYRYFLIVSFLFVFRLASAHPLHITVTNVDLYGDSVFVVLKIMKDDLELSSLSAYKDSLIKKNDIDLYINNYLKIFIGDSNAAIDLKNYSKYEEGDVVWVKLYSNEIRFDSRHILVKNKLLSNIYEDEQNLIFVEAWGRSWMKKLTHFETDFLSSDY